MINNLSNRACAWLAGTLIGAIAVLALVIAHLQDIAAAWLWIRWVLLLIAAIYALYRLYLLWHQVHTRHLNRSQQKEEIRLLVSGYEDEKWRADQGLLHAQQMEQARLEIEREKVRTEQMRAQLEHERLMLATHLSARHITVPATHGLYVREETGYQMLQAPRVASGPSIDNRTPDLEQTPASVVAPSLREELESGVLAAGHPFTFGYRVVTDPYTNITTLDPITDTHTRTLFLAGWSGTGKSSLVANAMARRARTQGNVAFLVFDPHKGAEEDSLAVQIAGPLSDWLIKPAGGEKITGKRQSEVRAAVQFLKQEAELRLDRPDLSPEQKRQISPYYGLDIWVIVDEVLSYARQTRLSKHDPAFDDLMFLLQTIATDTRKVGITGIYMTQLSTKEQLGEIEIKDACPRRIILQAPKDQGKALGLTGQEAAIAERFPQGRGYYMSKTGMEIFVWGYGSPRDIADALSDVSSPLVSKPDGNKMLYLPTSPHLEMGWKRDGNESGNTFPNALQARLDEIDDWQEKLAKMEALGPYAEKSDIWQVLFQHAPGGRSYQKEAAIFAVLVEASRHKHQQRGA